MPDNRFHVLVSELHNELRDPTSLTDEEKQLKSGLGENLFHYLILETDMEIVRKLADVGLPFDEPNNFGQTPLFECAMIGFLDRAEYLLKLGADPNRRNNQGESMLLYARELGRTEVVNLLLKYGAEPEQNPPPC